MNTTFTTTRVEHHQIDIDGLSTFTARPAIRPTR